jgi:hypothetical protein
MDVRQLRLALSAYPDDAEVVLDAQLGYNSVTSVEPIGISRSVQTVPNSKFGKWRQEFEGTERYEPAAVLRWNP